MTPFLETFWHIMLELAPWLLLGLTIASAMEVLLPEGWVKKQLSGRNGITKAVLFGIPLPLCSCAVIPVGLNLKKPETGTGPAVGFLISTPQTGIDSIFVTASMLGWPFAIFKMATALVTGIAGGLITSAIESDQKILSEQEPDTLPERMPESFVPLQVIEEDLGSKEPSHKKSKILRAFLHAEEMLFAIYRWLMIGIVISVLLTLWLDGQPLDSLSGYSLPIAMTIALIISLPWYVCAIESVPIAAALVAAGLPMGAIMVFLMAGPATNIATIGALWRGLGARPTIVYLTTIIVGSFAGGLLFELLISNVISTQVVDLHTCHTSHSNGIVGTFCAILMLIWIVRLAWIQYMCPKSNHPGPAHQH